MQYYVGEGDDRHLVDHPPLFACECEGRKTLLQFNQSFVDELVATAQDIMPGNLSEIAGVYFKPAEQIFTLPDFLIPAKIILYNPDNLRGPDALPYLVVLIDKRFFGIPAYYLTPDRFDGCEELRNMPIRRPRRVSPPGPGPSQSQSQGQAGRRPPSGPGPRRPPASGGSQKGPPPGKKPSGPRPPGQQRPPGNRRPDSNRSARPGGPRPRRPDESGARGSGGGGSGGGPRRPPR